MRAGWYLHLHNWQKYNNYIVAVEYAFVKKIGRKESKKLEKKQESTEKRQHIINCYQENEFLAKWNVRENLTWNDFHNHPHEITEHNRKVWGIIGEAYQKIGDLLGKMWIENGEVSVYNL